MTRTLTAMYAGLALTVGTVIVLFASGDLLADHVRAGYPTYSQARIDSAATTYLTLLSVVGVLGAASWLWTIRTVRSGKRWPATAMFVVGAGVALTVLLIRDTSGDTGLPPLLGWLGILPCVAGLAAITLLWRRS